MIALPYLSEYIRGGNALATRPPERAVPSCVPCHAMARNGEAGLRLVAAMWFHWMSWGHPAEGRLWLDRALALPGAPAAVRARALWASSLMATMMGDVATGDALAVEAGRLAEPAGDALTAARARQRLAAAALHAGDNIRGEQLAIEALSGFTAAGATEDPGRRNAVVRVERRKPERYRGCPQRGRDRDSVSQKAGHAPKSRPDARSPNGTPAPQSTPLVPGKSEARCRLPHSGARVL